MSKEKKKLEYHKAAAEHHEEAANHHRKAAEYHEKNLHEKAAHTRIRRTPTHPRNLIMLKKQASYAELFGKMEVV
jgi:hypothetical protein